MRKPRATERPIRATSRASGRAAARTGIRHTCDRRRPWPRPVAARAPVRPAQHGELRHCGRGVRHEVHLQLLAAGNGDPRRRHDGNPVTTKDREVAAPTSTRRRTPTTPAGSQHQGAALEVLRRYFGTDDIAYTLTAARHHAQLHEPLRGRQRQSMRACSAACTSAPAACAA